MLSCQISCVTSIHEYKASILVHSVHVLIYVTFVRSWNRESKYFSPNVLLHKSNVKRRRNTVLVVVIYIFVKGGCFVMHTFLSLRTYFVSNKNSGVERYADNLVGFSFYQYKIKSNSWPKLFILIWIYSLGICKCKIVLSIIQSQIQKKLPNKGLDIYKNFNPLKLVKRKIVDTINPCYRLMHDITPLPTFLRW